VVVDANTAHGSVQLEATLGAREELDAAQRVLCVESEPDENRERASSVERVVVAGNTELRRERLALPVQGERDRAGGGYVGDAHIRGGVFTKGDDALAGEPGEHALHSRVVTRCSDELARLRSELDERGVEGVVV